MKRDDVALFMIVLLSTLLVVLFIIGINLRTTVDELKSENEILKMEIRILQSRDDINTKHIERLHLLGGEELMKKVYAEDVKEN